LRGIERMMARIPFCVNSYDRPLFERTEAKLEAEIAERKRMETEIERSHQELLIASRQAGTRAALVHGLAKKANSYQLKALERPDSRPKILTP
jgi:phosphoglycerate-specific signal transduction histidine kinase